MTSLFETACERCHGCKLLAVYEDDRHQTKTCPDCHGTGQRPLARLFACGCILVEGEMHYCSERQQRVIVLPRGLCEHEHWDMRTESCAQCGLTREQRYAGTLEVVQP